MVTGTYNGQPVTDTYEAPFGDVQKSFTLMSLESSMVGITYVTISGLHSPAYCTIDSITAYK